MILLEKTRKIGKKYYGNFRCDVCNNIKEMRIDAASRQHSCGCNRTGISKDPAYFIWEGIKQRCYNKNAVMYKWYGGRGITVCDDWKDNSKSFVDWAYSNGYKKGLTIDRIDNSKEYSPTNCQWLSRIDNLNKDRNKRKPMSTVSKIIYNNILLLAKRGHTSKEIAEYTGYSTRYIRQLVSKEFIPRTIMGKHDKMEGVIN